jgi:D-glycero-D-manno-heptose 1,7-bisphosphate phosphatase
MHSKKRKVIFLDRDGVVNRERGDFTWKLEDFKINDDLFEALSIFKKNGFEFIVISNQSGIARGLYTATDVEFLHHQLMRIAASKGISFLEIYYCPHHPDSSRCICRKPDSLLLEKSMARFDIDPEKSFFIGDAERDVEAGRKAGIQAIRIQPNSSLLAIVPDIIGT